MVSSLAERIAVANAEALSRIDAATPILTRVRPAREAIPALAEDVLFHAGPPVAPNALCGPMRGAVIGALVYEGRAADPAQAETLLAKGAVELQCTHDSGVVGPMAGIVSGSMPLLEVRESTFGGAAYAPLNEGIGAVLRFGAYEPSVIDRLGWLRDVLAPALDEGLQRMGGIPLVPLMARALTMGDEMHQRNVAATSLFVRGISPALAAGAMSAETLSSILRFLAETDQFFLNVAMAAAKSILDTVREVPYSTIVTVMSRNGTEFAIRVSGLGDRWFVAAAPDPEGLYFPGFTAADVNPDMGDSAILECLGLGAFAMAAAPAVMGFVGLPSAADALSITRSMGEITAGQSRQFKIPVLDFDGTPTGIDIRRVVRLEVTPIINTGIAHRRAGVGQIGAGVVHAPLEVFQDALEAFTTHYTAKKIAGV